MNEKRAIAHKTRERDIRHSRVPLPEIYSSISEAFYPAYTGEAETPDVEVGWIAVLPVPGDLRSRLVFERNSRWVTIPDTWFGDHIHDPMQRSGSWQLP